MNLSGPGLRGRLLPILTVLLTAYSFSVNAQVFDSLHVRVGIIGTVAKEDYQPLLITANHWGAISEDQADVSPYLELASQNLLYTRRGNADSSKKTKLLTLGYGASLLFNEHFNTFIARQVYGQLNFDDWSFRAGRFESMTGEMDKDLSSGSLGVSANAIPIPKIGFSINKYKNFPWTHGHLQFKGTFYHGWMGNDQYLTKAYYHEKTLYMRLLLGKKLRLYGGLQHFGIWGGERGNTHLDRSLDGFINVLLVQEARDGGGLPSNIRPGRAGDQRGLIEVGADWENEKVLLHFYNQTPFETGVGIDIRNIDRLAGLSVQLKNKPRGFQKVLGEFIYTKQMESYGRELHSYYNNGVYRTGWEYEDRVIGTPLFINRTRAANYYSTIHPYDWHAPDTAIGPSTNIVNNKVVGFNLGVIFRFSDRISSKTNLIFTKNYGQLYANEFSAALPSEFYSLEEIYYTPLNSRWSFMIGAAVDAGDLSDNVAGVLKVEWRVK